MMSLEQFYKPLPDIGLFAEMRSGKDEVYKILEKMGYKVERVAFGDIMKESFHQRFPNIPKIPKPIKQLQHYGEAMRAIDPYVWVRPTMARTRVRADILAQAGLDTPTFVFTDIRNIYEYQAVKDSGAFMVRIKAPLEVRVKRMLELGETVSPEILNAPTETVIETFEADYVLHNDGTYNDLEKAVTEMIFKIQEKRMSE
jgi:dephospho-CoA kinase